jgi:hypothetical protein
MKVIANNPIVYSNAFGDNLRSTISSLKDKAKGVGGKIKAQGGALETAKMLAQTFGKGGQQEQPQQQQQQEQAPPPPPPKGMSKGLKMGLIIGGSVLVLTIIGVVIYKTSKGSKK